MITCTIMLVTSSRLKHEVLPRALCASTEGSGEHVNLKVYSLTLVETYIIYTRVLELFILKCAIRLRVIIDATEPSRSRVTILVSVLRS